MKELRRLFDLILENPDYDFLPQTNEQRMLNTEIERLNLDEQTENLLCDIIAEWESYGFINGFVYAFRLLKECCV